jgi:hypothetical protein
MIKKTQTVIKFILKDILLPIGLALIGKRRG